MAVSSGSYNLIRTSTTTSTAITIQQVTVPAGTLAEFTRAWVNQSTITTSAATRIQLLRKSTAATVTSATPGLLGVGMQASKCVGGTGATGITASAEGTDSTVYIEEGFNIVGNGWLYLPVPEERIALINTTLGLKFPTAPTSAGWISGQEWIEMG
jgi:hypothetical protein